MTSIILVVLGTVNLQFHGTLVPISLQSSLEIMAAEVLGIVWSSIQLTSPPGVLVSIRQLTRYGSEYHLLR